MKSTDLAPAAVLVLCFSFSVSCSRNVSVNDAMSAECPLLDEYESRLVALEGPLGCTETETLAPDPPGGCDGARQFLVEVRANLATRSSVTD